MAQKFSQGDKSSTAVNQKLSLEVNELYAQVV